MTVVFAAAGGVLAAWVLLAASGALITHPVLQRRNYRDFQLPTALGLLLAGSDWWTTFWATAGTGDCGGTSRLRSTAG